MSRICPEYPGSDASDHSVAADVLLRHEPDEEEDDEEEEDDKRGRRRRRLLGVTIAPPLHVLAGAQATKRQVVLKPRILVTEGEGRPPGRNQPRLVTPDTLLRIGR
jgi:hypothetical protein